jgi:DNA-binding NarL/FixJ family response regulator
VTGAEAFATTRVVLVDDHALFRAGVRSELDGLVDVVGDAATVAEAVELIAAEQPDVVLLDVHMPDGGGLEVIRRLRAAGGAASVQFLALSVSDAAEDVIGVIRAGARGYVTKTISGADLADAVRRVHGGDAVFSPRLAGFVLDAFAGGGGAREAPPDRDADLDQLTPREREVLQHIARGYMYKEIALRLGISATESAVLSHDDGGALAPPSAGDAARCLGRRRSSSCRRRLADGQPPTARPGGCMHTPRGARCQTGLIRPFAGRGIDQASRWGCSASMYARYWA